MTPAVPPTDSSAACRPPEDARRPVALAHELHGPAGAPLVVLLHSIGTDRALWRGCVAPLVAAGRRVAAVDLRGHGASPVPPGPYALDDLARDVVSLLDRLGVATADVAGVSMGGAVALWLAVHSRDRVRRLAVCCSGASFGDPALWRERAALVRERGMVPLADAVVPRWFSDRVRRDDPALVDALVDGLLACPPDGYAGCAEALGGTDLTPLLERIVAPTLVVAGRDDVVTPVDPAARTLVDGIANATISVVPTAHLAPYERPDLVAPLLVQHFDG